MHLASEEKRVGRVVCVSRTQDEVEVCVRASESAIVCRNKQKKRKKKAGTNQKQVPCVLIHPRPVHGLLSFFSRSFSSKEERSLSVFFFTLSYFN